MCVATYLTQYAIKDVVNLYHVMAITSAISPSPLPPSPLVRYTRYSYKVNFPSRYKKYNIIVVRYLLQYYEILQ